MTLKEIIDKIIKSDTNTDDPDWEIFQEALGAPNYFSYNWDKWNERLKGYFYQRWLCTDSWVGGTAFFLDDELVAIQWQSARKSSPELRFISPEAADKVKEYMAECAFDDTEGPILIEDGELDQEMGDGYKVTYGEQILHKTAIVEKDGRRCEIIKRWRAHNDIELWKMVMVRFPDGSEETIPVSELLLPYMTEE